MIEVMIRLEKKIADDLAIDASDRGISVQELIRDILGEYAVTHIRLPEKMSAAMKSALGELEDLFEQLGKKMLKSRASSGALQCKNCTMKLTEKDVDNGKCGSCGAPLKEALSEDKKDEG